MKVKNIRISRWRGYVNCHDSEELRDVRRLGGAQAVRKMGHYIPPREAYEKNVGTYGRFDEAVRVIDPRKE